MSEKTLRNTSLVPRDRHTLGDCPSDIQKLVETLAVRFHGTGQWPDVSHFHVLSVEQNVDEGNLTRFRSLVFNTYPHDGTMYVRVSPWALLDTKRFYPLLSNALLVMLEMFAEIRSTSKAATRDRSSFASALHTDNEALDLVHLAYFFESNYLGLERQRDGDWRLVLDVSRLKRGSPTVEDLFSSRPLKLEQVSISTEHLFVESTVPDPKKIFVVSGRNEVARRAIFDFLRSVGLSPMEWSQMVRLTGSAAPYVGNVLTKGFEVAQAVVALLTGDDEAFLRSTLLSSSEPQEAPSYQPRQNVLLETGMALALHPHRTILVEIGHLRPISDLGGLHTIRLDNTVDKRQHLLQRLRDSGCVLDSTGTDWHTTGSFDLPQQEDPVRINYDEIDDLRTVLRARMVGKQSLLKWLQLAFRAHPRRVSDAGTVLELLKGAGIRRGIETAFWYLVVDGVFKFTGTKTWWKGEPTWESTLPFVRLARRGEILFDTLRPQRSR